MELFLAGSYHLAKWCQTCRQKVRGNTVSKASGRLPAGAVLAFSIIASVALHIYNGGHRTSHTLDMELCDLISARASRT